MLEKNTLQNLIKEFISRNGTDNGYEQDHDSSLSSITALLKTGEAIIVFDQKSQSPNIILSNTLNTQNDHDDDNDNDNDY